MTLQTHLSVDVDSLQLDDAIFRRAQHVLELHGAQLQEEGPNSPLSIDGFVALSQTEDEAKYLIARLVEQKLTFAGQPLRLWTLQDFQSRVAAWHSDAVLTGFQNAHALADENEGGCFLDSRDAPFTTSPRRTYSIQDVVGRGGFGTVYHAIDQRLQKRVALKVLHAAKSKFTVSDDFAAAREAKVSAKLDDIGAFVGALDYGMCWLGPFVVYELIEGIPIDKWAKGRPWQELVEVVAQVADALGQAHRRGVFHYDISPANILITQDNQPRIIDMGLAAELHEMRFFPVGIRGTRPYMWRRLETGEARDSFGRPDVDSLVAVLYELLGGDLSERPFRHLDEIQGHSELVPSELAVAIDNMLRGSISSARQLHESLNQILAAHSRSSINHRSEPVLHAPGLVLNFDGRTFPSSMIATDDFAGCDEALAQFRDGFAPSAVLQVVGPPQSGKSAVIGEFLRRLGRQSYRSPSFRRLGDKLALLAVDCSSCRKSGDLLNRVCRMAGLELTCDAQVETPDDDDLSDDEFDDSAQSEGLQNRVAELMGDLSSELRGCRLIAVFDQLPARSLHPEVWRDLTAILAHKAFRQGGAIIACEGGSELTAVQQRILPPPIKMLPMSELEFKEFLFTLFCDDLALFRGAFDEAASAAYAELEPEVRYPYWIYFGSREFLSRHDGSKPFDAQTFGNCVLTGYCVADDALNRLCGSSIRNPNGEMSVLGSLFVAAVLAELPITNGFLEQVNIPESTLQALLDQSLIVRTQREGFALSRVAVVKLRERVRALFNTPGHEEAVQLVARNIIAVVRSSFERDDFDVDRKISAAVSEAVMWLGSEFQSPTPLEQDLLDYLLPLMVNDRYPRVDAAYFNRLYDEGKTLRPGTKLNLAIISFINEAKFGRNLQTFFERIDRTILAVECSEHLTGNQVRSLDLAAFYGARRFRCASRVLQMRRALMDRIAHAATYQPAEPDVQLSKWAASWALNTVAMGLVDREYARESVIGDLHIAHTLVFDNSANLPKASSGTARRGELWLHSRYHWLKAQWSLRLNDLNKQVEHLHKAALMARDAMETVVSPHASWWAGYYLRLARCIGRNDPSDEAKLDQCADALAVLRKTFGDPANWSLELRARVAAMETEVAGRLGDFDVAMAAAKEALAFFDNATLELVKDNARAGDARALLVVAKIYRQMGIMHRSVGDGESAHRCFQQALNLLDEKPIRNNGTMRLWQFILDMVDNMSRLETNNRWDFDTNDSAPTHFGKLLVEKTRQCRQWLENFAPKSWHNGPLALQLANMRWRVEGSLHSTSQLYLEFGAEWRQHLNENSGSRDRGPRVFANREVMDRILTNLHNDRMRQLQGIESQHGRFPELLLEMAFRESQYQRLRVLKGDQRIYVSGESLERVFRYYNDAASLWPNNLTIREAQAHFYRYVWMFHQANEGFRKLLALSPSSDQRSRVQRALAECLLTVAIHDLEPMMKGDFSREAARLMANEALEQITSGTTVGIVSDHARILKSRVELECGFLNDSIPEWSKHDESYELVMNDNFTRRFVENIELIREHERRLADRDKDAVNALIREPTRYLTLGELGKLYLRYAEILYIQGMRDESLIYSRRTYELFRTAAMFQVPWGGERTVTKYLRARAIMTAVDAARSINPFADDRVRSDVEAERTKSPAKQKRVVSQLSFAKELLNSAMSSALGLFKTELQHWVHYADRLELVGTQIDVPPGLTGYQYWRVSNSSHQNVLGGSSVSRRISPLPPNSR